MADLDGQDKEILTCYADGYDLTSIAQMLGVRRTVVSEAVGRLCRYEVGWAQLVLAGGELPPVEEPSAPPTPIPKPEPEPQAARKRRAAAPKSPATLGELIDVLRTVPKGDPAAAETPPAKKRGRPLKALKAAAPVEPPPSHGPLVEPIVLASDGAFGSVPTASPTPIEILGDKLDQLATDAGLLPAAVPPRLAAAAVVPDPETITSYVQWWCLDCGGQYGRPFRVHGAPHRCDGQLHRVLVTVTRLDGPP